MSCKISSVLGNSQKLDGGAMFGNVPRALWSRWNPPDDLNRVFLACRAMLIEIDDQKILFETGIGCFFEPKMAERFGVVETEHKLLENLHRLGFEENDIDMVVLSHLHFDHAGGLLPSYQEIQDGRDDLLFPKAQYVVGREAYSRAEAPHFRDRASFIPGLIDKLKDSGRLQIVENPEQTLCGGRVGFRISNGHTPGQLHAVVKGDEEEIFFAGDLIPGCPWVHVPVTMGYDRYPEQLIDEKIELYMDFEGKNWRVFYTHDPDFALSGVGKNDKGKFEAIDQEVNLVQRPF